MKKLNALVAAISLGLTVSFAALPVVSAHSTLNIGNSTAHEHHTTKVVHEQQKHTPIPQPHRNGYKPNEECKGLIGFTGGGTQVPSAGTAGGTAPVTPIQGENFDVPANCPFSLEDNIQVQNSNALNPAVAGLEANFQVTCTLFRDDVNGGTDTAIVSAMYTLGEDQQFATFPLSAYVSPTTSVYSGYGYGRYPFLVHYDVRCSQTGPLCVVAFATVCTVNGFPTGVGTTLTISSVGSAILGKPHITPGYRSQYNYRDSGYYTKSINHIINH